ncbi:peptidase domain-containing ABC transporter [Sphingomonas sanguinis]|uniref:peptidase domain-containing ABC transporter n=1 Tax=Sphingomonas sanguinis TaxID=33051 RepID=UPI001C566EDE|nr:peptidase domain-containing ABC transporter [Sphingomonas sanguinis]QXT34376.1 peptidase domain-containing ABC transporter [Sphingomonas sanguinis]
MIPPLNLSGRRRLPIVRQAEAAECGLASIAMIAGFYGHDIDLATMRRRFGLSMKGVTLRTLIDVAAGLGFSSRPVRCEAEELANLRRPAILHWGTNHFVVLERVTRRGIVIHDPANGRVAVAPAVLSRMFTGVALELTPNAAFQRARERNPLKLGGLFTLEGGIATALLQVIVLSLVVEGLLVASPFYLQFVIDDAILKGDRSVLQVLAIAFGLLTIFRVATTFLRGLTTQFIANVLSFDMKGRIFHHMVRLPLDWFQKRQIGDVQSRFWAIRSIQAFASQGALTGLLDGILGFVVLVLMFLYSPVLVAIVFGSIAAYASIKGASFQLTKRFAADAIMTDAREQTRFLETLRAAQTIKAAGSETVRESQYRNASAASINAQIRSGNIGLGAMAADQLLNGLTDVIVIFIGARSVISGQLTVGMLTAFLAYKGQFVARFTNLVEQLFSWRLLDLQLERLADIVLTPKEARIDSGGHEGVLDGNIVCQNLSFRYAYGESLILQNFSMSVKSGECVAIIGSSGCGKSTLAKLITGLYEASGGEVLIDGRPLKHWSNRSLRSQISYVSQEDQLLTGSIAENIAFFAEKIDIERVRQCARTAFVDDEISAMPMGYESLVGDMGSSLSGGQKQRIIIARALYRSPRILVLDEATAHLDVANERAISKALAALTITRIVIAHRPETIAASDRVISLDRRELPSDLLDFIKSRTPAVQES